MNGHQLKTLERFQRIAKLNRVVPPSDEFANVDDEICDIRSGLNALFYRNAEPWMLPHWAVKSIKDKSDDGDSSTDFPNDRFRNWLIIGEPGARSFGTSDSQGLATSLPSCGSLDFWISKSEGIDFPALSDYDGPRMTLISPEDQHYEWTTQVGSVIFKRLVYHATDDSGKEYIYNEISLQNVALESTDFTFFAAQRPMSIVGVEPIESLEYDSDKRLLFVNGFLSLMIDSAPSSVVMGTANNPNLIQVISDEANRMDGEYTATRGLATCIMRFDLKIGPAQRKQILFVSPLDAVTVEDSLPHPDFSSNARDSSIERWFKFAGKKLAGTYPDMTLGMVLSQSKASLAMKAMSWLFSESEKPADEIVRVLLALARTGCIDITHVICEKLVQNISKPAKGTPIFNSPYIWIFLHIYELHKTEELFSTISPFILENINELLDSINEYISKPEDVSSIDMEPAEVIESESGQHADESISQDMPVDEDVPIDEVVDLESVEESIPDVPIEEEPTPPVDPVYGINILTTHLWHLSALQAYANNSELISKGDSTIDIANTLSEYENYVVEQFNEFNIEDMEISIPMITNMVSLVGNSSLLRMNNITGPFLEALIKKNFDSRIIKGLLKYPAPIDKSSSHHALRLAHHFVLEQNRFQAEAILEKTLSHISEYYCLPDWVNLKSGGGSSGDGCSLSAAADILLLVRDMMIIEDGQNIAMLQGIPEPWFTSEKPLIVSRIPTINGTINVELGPSTNQHQIEITMNQLPEELIVYMPSHFPLKVVKVFGGSIVDRITEPSAKLKIIPHSNTLVLTFHK
ncbi:MAG: hypothetical protein ACTSQZ_05320 [Candidatus Thorarchaeota archaeon]